MADKHLRVTNRQSPRQCSSVEPSLFAPKSRRPLVMAGYTALASRVLTALKSAAHMRALNRVFGTLFVFLSVFKRVG